MVRPIKEGLDYFPLDVDIDQDDKIALIEANHGLEGFGVVIKLLMKIYDNSYYYRWEEKEQLLFSRRVNVDISKVNVVINDCLKWDLFSKPLYEKHQILSSKGIQKRYLEASSRRKEVRIDDEHLLLSRKEVNVYRNLIIVSNNLVNDDISTQSKVEESKVKESKEKVKEINTPTSPDDAIVFYQNNFGVISPHVSEDLLSWINDMGEDLVLESLSRALDRNKANWGYAKSILQSWHKKGIKTIEQAKAEEVQFQNQQATKKPYYQKQQSNEVVPDWFKDKKHKQAASQSSSSNETKNTDEIAKRLAEYQRASGGGS
ncbi:Lin1244/Lin1753 domain-containing protein [Oceanobacillus sp. CF4.6]|uniref:Lin1244/Lin1753 domain-containing protein n=1 Tax=Oceanobacillus sp. CF4.6 TaxID=3373080 RepID=UPI003EE56AC5